MKKLFILLILAGNVIHTYAQREKVLSEKLANIDTVIQRVMSDWRVPGVAVGVVYKDKLIYARGFGYRDLQLKLPVTTQTIFPIASCTKPFTAMLVGINVADGNLNIERPVSSYLPKLKFFRPELTGMVTAKDLMTHRTGLPRHDWAMQANPPMSLDTILSRMEFLEPSAQFRDKVQYNNNTFALLGLLTRQVSGKAWEVQLKERILDPLEMFSTTAKYAQLSESMDYSKGYVVVADTLKAGAVSTEGAHPSGSMNSNVLDMTKWLSACIDDGKYKQKQILPQAYLKDATTPQMSTPSRPNARFPAYPDVYFGDYGYAWLINSYRGHYLVQHSGDLPLYSSNVSFFPTDSIGIVVLANKFDATVPEMITSYIADRLLDLPFKDWNKLILAMRAKQSKHTPAAPSVQENLKPMQLSPLGYVGVYVDRGYGTIEIKWDGEKFVAFHNGKKFAFAHHSDNQFLANVPGGKLTFLTNRDRQKAEYIIASLEEGVSDIKFSRIK